MKIKILFISIVLLLGIAPFTYKWWPSSKAQDFIILLFHHEDISSLYEQATEMSFDRIAWCKNNTHNNFRRNSRALTQAEISNDIEVKEFLAYANTKDVPCFTVQKDQPEWLVTASYDGHQVELNGKPAKSQIARFYYFSETPNNLGCSERGDDKSKLHSCRSHLFSNWYLLEETIISLQEDVLTNDI